MNEVNPGKKAAKEKQCYTVEGSNSRRQHLLIAMNQQTISTTKVFRVWAIMAAITEYYHVIIARNSYSMKQLTSSQPLAYLLPNSDLVTALPYIDEELPELKSKVNYLIRAQQATLPYDRQAYLKDLQLPQTPYVNSEKFEEQARRILEKVTNKAEGGKKAEKSKVFDIPVVKGDKIKDELIEDIRKAAIRHQNNLIKEVNLEILQKFGPLLMKEHIAALDRRKQVLLEKIQAEKSAIEQINKKRRYQQLEAQEREQTVSSRTEVMVHKKRRVE